MSTTMRSMLLLAAVGAAACTDTNGPEADAGFDEARVEAGLAVVERVGGTPVLRSFEALGSTMGGTAAGPSFSGAGRMFAAVQRVAGLVGPRTSAALVPIIRNEALGRTFVYDAETDRYVVDPARPGAPANGVRFVLYHVNETTGRPATAEIGHADLTDQRAASSTSAGLRLVVVSGNVTHLDYAFELSGTIASAALNVDGYISDGVDRVNFDIATTGQLFGRSGTVTVAADLEVVGRDFAVSAELVGQAGEENGDGSIDLTVTAGADVVSLQVEVQNSQLDATATVNGAIFATATGPTAEPVIRGAGGNEPTAAELHALGHLVAFTGGVFDLLGGLLAPAGVLLLVGLGL